ncbi:MAG: glycoside hydrolase family 2 TIM barrel-domain containing protein [Myxococcota bacterium]
MSRRSAARAIVLSSACLAAAPSIAAAQAVPVEVRQTSEGWQLFRGGEPYFIRGAGGDGPLDALAEAGGNSLRTWGAEGIDGLLDQAHALGLTVTVGIWLGHERHGFDYHDEVQVREQYERARAAVMRYKDHPAVLLWGVGNEMEGFDERVNPAVWKAVNDIALMIKELDPNHPTMTVTAELGGDRLEGVQKHCPAIDIHGINSYGGAFSVAERYKSGGATKPYVLTETGPLGVWEIPPNEWGATAEPTSTEKAKTYRHVYASAVTSAKGLALGAYVFTWGSKNEATPTWYGMFLQDGASLAAVDTMTEIWSGKPPDNLAPTVEPLVVEPGPRSSPGGELRVRAQIGDPEGASVRTRWELRQDPTDYAGGGDYRPTPQRVDGAVLEGGQTGARVRMPNQPGKYRLFVYAHDDTGRAATANVPLLVEGEARASLPFYVYRDGFEGMPWWPSGWMGEIESLTVRGDHTGRPYEGDQCIEMRFEGAPGSWVGVAWQNPPDNWGEQAGGYDLTGARDLEFWARGKFSGETISVGVGLIGEDQPHPDSDKATLDDITLTYEWKRYRVRLRRRDLSSLKTGFFITIKGTGLPVTVYLDSIRFVGK